MWSSPEKIEDLLREISQDIDNQLSDSKGANIYLAPTADARDSWQATLRHIACEGRCFVLGCNQFVTKSVYPADLWINKLLNLTPFVDDSCL